MKIAHTVVVTPHRAGIYETVRDLVAAERANDADAVIVDPTAVSEDRGVPIGGGFNPSEFDVIVNHSGLGQYEHRINGTPVIHCMHGRPESSFRLEEKGVTPVYTYLAQTAGRSMYKRWVTFWQEFIPYWRLVLPEDRLSAMTPPVDLQAWTPNGPSGYKFGGKSGAINAVISDMWREDVTPFHCIHAFAQWAQSHPNARLHLYGIQRTKPLDVILKAVERQGCLGEVKGYVKGLANVYRAANVLISPNKIATRAIREAMACGCPVLHDGQSDIGGSHCDMSDQKSFATGMNSVQKVARSTMRAIAEDKYDSRHTAEQMIALCGEVIDDARS